MVSFLILYIRSNWWLIEFKLARWRWERKNELESEQKFDVFVSYSSNDQDWIDHILMKNLEPGYKLCLHERDFQIGQSIIENIVECLSQSKCCFIILSENYVKSDWCNFEALVAQTILKDKLTMIVLDQEVTAQKNLSAVIKALVKTRTFINWDEKDSKFWRRIDEAITRKTIMNNNNEL